MKIKTKLTLLILAVITFNSAFGQTTQANNQRPASTAYLGWNSAGTTGTLDIKNDFNSSINFYTNGGANPKAIILSGGNFGIGTSSPLQLLHVAGNANLTTGYAYKIDNYNVLRLDGVDVLVGPGGSTVGNYNTTVGYDAGSNFSANGNYNTCVGYLAGSVVEGNSWNTFIGYQAGANTTSNYTNLAIDNTFVGADAGYNNGEGSSNTFIGEQSGYSTYHANANDNTFVGASAGYSNTTAKDNTFLGSKAGYFNATGTGNVLLGYTTGNFNVSGSNNTITGYQAAYGVLNNSHSNNSIYGYQTAYTISTGGDNCFFGYKAAYANGTGNSNVVIGKDASYHNSTGSNNTILGYQAGNGASTYSHSNNTFVGFQCGFGIRTGGNNTFYGYSTGTGTTTGSYNVFIGNASGQSNATGQYNAFLGMNSGLYNTTSYNTFLGHNSGVDNTSGNQNVFAGYMSGGDNTTGYFNTFIGSDAGRLNTDADYNTFIGYYAGRANTTGAYNTAVGDNAGDSYATASYNTFLGYDADNGGTYDNCMMLGNYARPYTNAANHIALGNTSITEAWVKVAWTTGSDARIKNNVQENVHGLDFIKLLRPVTYHYDIDVENQLLGISQQENGLQNDTLDYSEVSNASDWQGKYDVEEIQFSGFIAQEVDEAANQIGYDFSGIDKPEEENGLWGLRYSEFVVPLVKAVQEQQDSIVKLNEKQLQYEERLAQLEQLVSMCCASGSNKMDEDNSGSSPEKITNVDLIHADNVILYQNTPNPFGEETNINYYLPQSVTSAVMVFYDNTGKSIKEVVLEHRGNASLKVNASELASGIYAYSIIVDGNAVDSKKMLKNK